MSQSLEDLRRQIDSIDDQLLDLLNRRMEIVKEVGKLKKNENTVIYRPEREMQIIERLHQKTAGLLNRQALEAIFLEIFAASRNLELPEKVAYLGPEGSFTHAAAESRFGAMSEYLAMPAIATVFEAVQTGKARFGVVPIENNQEGVVAETMDSLESFNLKIVAEVAQPIHFCLATVADSITSIRKIYSKDIAFRQCQNFMSKYLRDQEVHMIPVNSTSEAARMALKEGPETAALCSSVAAKIYKLPVLFDNVEDADYNMTRFLILAKDFINQKGKQDKTTILAKLPDKPGGLVSFLQDFHQRNINLTKIESRPVRGERSFATWFYIEFDGHRDDDAVQEILNKYDDRLIWLGSYVKAL
ncbi:chorismate mutase [Flammeovirgaceae bacterium 311]|nr:chorismate mutase [Flammeovirgaceae bacterium 311]